MYSRITGKKLLDVLNDPPGFERNNSETLHALFYPTKLLYLLRCLFLENVKASIIEKITSRVVSNIKTIFPSNC